MRLVVDTNVFISAALKDSSWPAHTIRWLPKYDGLLKPVFYSSRVQALDKFGKNMLQACL